MRRCAYSTVCLLHVCFHEEAASADIFGASFFFRWIVWNASHNVVPCQSRSRSHPNCRTYMAGSVCVLSRVHVHYSRAARGFLHDVVCYLKDLHPNYEQSNWFSVPFVTRIHRIYIELDEDNVSMCALPCALPCACYELVSTNT